MIRQEQAILSLKPAIRENFDETPKWILEFDSVLK